MPGSAFYVAGDDGAHAGCVICGGDDGAAGVARQSCVGRYSGEAVAVGPADADAGMYAGRGAGNSACSWRRSLEARSLETRQMLRTVTTVKAVSNKIMAALMVTIK